MKLLEASGFFNQSKIELQFISRYDIKFGVYMAVVRLERAYRNKEGVKHFLRRLFLKKEGNDVLFSRCQAMYLFQKILEKFTGCIGHHFLWVT